MYQGVNPLLDERLETQRFIEDDDSY